MSPTTQAILGSWSFNPGLTVGAVVSLILYFRGWQILHRILPRRFPVWRLNAFIGGVAAIWIAVESPLDAFSNLLLSAHMVQHLLLLLVGPPLILLAWPLLPLLRGLPRKIARDAVGPFLVWPPLHRIARKITHPITCWMAMAVTLCAWHVPAAFDLTLRSPAWHKIEHGCFVGASLLFWWPVIRPFPGRARWPLWSMPLYLLASDLLNTIISAIFTFSDHVFYTQYLQAPRLFGTTAISDQSCAGVIMWVPGSLFFLIPAVVIAVRCLSPTGLSAGRKQPALEIFRSARREAPFDLLAVPVAGALLRTLTVRRAMQALLLILAALVIVDGMFGSQVSAFNLAGVLPWTYWRAFAVIALLAAGNFFCMACPFMLFRELGRRLGLRQRSWPAALRSKWFAIVLLALFFWCYEAFQLWDKPIWTAWLIINYFLIAFAIDALFRGASFCKYVCPIGQFQFVMSLVSPLEVKVRQADICAHCKTHDCLRGNENHRGCEMNLYLPKKSGNFDCTFCLDCVRACPHDNIGILAAAPGMDIVRDPPRSSVGRFSQRPDIAVLSLLFVFAAFATAAFMTPSARISISMLAVLALIPAALAVAASFRDSFCRFAMSLVPLGAAMWAAHYLFHLNTGWNSIWTALRRAADAAGWHSLLAADSLLTIQAVCLDAGLLLTLYLAWRIARSLAPRGREAFTLFAPWAGVAAALYALGIWVFLQPMDMTGVLRT